MATLNLGRIKPVFRDAYAGGTAYVVDDIVTFGDETFICILASTGNATSNATYWKKLAAKGTDGTDLTSTLTTQGDIAYRDGSGLARLGFGTSGHFLKTQGTGANPVWAESGGKFESQLFHVTCAQITPSVNSWGKCTLDTIKTNEITGATLSTGVISLPVGTYFVHGQSSFYRNNDYNNRLYNTTDSADLIVGTGGHSWASPNDATSPNSLIIGRFTLSGTKNIEYQLITNSSNGQTSWQSGHPNQVCIWKTA